MLEATLSSAGATVIKFESLLNKAFVTLFKEYLSAKCKNLADLLNSSNYAVEDDLDKNCEKLFNQAEKLTKQWKTQLSEGNFAIFTQHLVESFCFYFLENLKFKKISFLGAIKLEKETKRILNFFTELSGENVRKSMTDLLAVVRVFSCEDKEQVESVVKSYSGRLKLRDFLVLYENKLN